MSDNRRRFLLGIAALPAMGMLQGDSARADQGSAAPSPPATIHLPETLGAWRRREAPRRITAKDLFAYMDGAGELYLGYGFDHLDVTRYEYPGHGEISVELYWLRTSDDAYGLLSNDWGGERIDLKDGRVLPAAQDPNHAEALYGAGLLRFRNGNLYGRVMADRESADAKKVVLELGRLATAKREFAPPPRLVTALPAAMGANHRLAADSVCFFRSYLVLNAICFLGVEDILNLDSTGEAVIASYRSEKDSKKRTGVRLLLIRYPGEKEAVAALRRFRREYLEEKGRDRKREMTARSGTIEIEDGWTGYRLAGKNLTLVFEAPDAATVEVFLKGSEVIFNRVRDGGR
jgi:hypothetical protein